MIIDKLKALAGETRLKIMRELLSGKKTVTDISLSVNKSQPAVSISLKQLLHAQLITQERKGKQIYYALKNKKNLKEILRLIENG